MTRRVVTNFILFALILAVPGYGQSSEGLSMPTPLEYSEARLDNGLTVITHEDHSTPIINLQLWYHVGSKNEKAGRTGFAHLFEHLVFKGSANIEPEEFDGRITGVGGVINAYTTDDVTVYWETFPSNYLEMILWMEADRMKSLDGSGQNFQSEREVVKEERRVRVESPPYGDLFETLYSNAFDVHPYKHIPIGSMEDLDNATIEDVVEFYQTYYVPGNAYLVIAGDFDTRQALDWTKQCFGDIPGSEDAIERVTVREPAHEEERRIPRTKAVPLPAYVAGYYIPEDGHPDSYPLVIASSILSGARSSRVYQSLVYETQLAVQADASSSFRQDPNLFFEINRLQSDPVPEDELEQVKAFLVGSFPLTIETPGDPGARLANLAVYDLGAEYLATYRDELASVRVTAVARVAQEIHADDVIIVLVGKTEDFLEELQTIGSVEVIPIQMLDLNSPSLRNPEQ